MKNKEKLINRIESLKNDLESIREKETNIALITDSDGYGDIQTCFDSLENSEKLELNFKIKTIIEAFIIKKIEKYENELSKL